MPKTYLIGGAPRAGKTTTLHEFIKDKPILGTSTDAIRETLRDVLSPQNSPDLFNTIGGNFNSLENIHAMRENPQQVVDQQNTESEAVWRSVLKFIEANHDDGRDVVLEGVAILPHNLAQLDFEHKVVFLVNLEDQTETILEHARSSKFDWLHKYSDELIKAFCIYSREQNKYFYEEARKYNLPVVVTKSNSFSEDIHRAVQILNN